MKTRLAAPLMLLGLCGASSAAPEAKPEQAAKASAEEAAQATIKGDFGKLADLTYPRIVEKVGGRDRMIATLESGLKDMKSKGYAFRSAKVGDPSPAVAGGPELFTVIPMTLVMKAPGGTLTVQGFMLGISGDMGKTWTFVDGAKADNEEFKKLLPNLPPALKLPKPEKPVFRKGQ
jgi:hypothetical protein